ncbi:MAG: TRAP transporter substrate-binding protein [Eubacterium sp.]|nr:TRAP transporter substrate-binding protein [Eubacterium sp.]MBR0396677.1 TRAP transporter substrate-binding protein [Eubacterium sp.]
MKKKTQLLALLLAVSLLTGLLTGCSGQEKSKESVTLTVAHVLTETHAYHQAWLKVAELVEERTNGGLKLEVFANSTLGNERDVIEGMQLGIVDLSCMSTGALASFSPAFMALDLPFIFDSRENAYKVLDSEIGDELLASLDESMLVGVTFWENGFRNISNSKRDVVTPEDVKGLKIRTLENELQVAAFTTLGANAIPMAWGEVYTALQQGTIDGQENPLAIIYQNKIHEVTKHVSLTGHFYAAAPVVMSKKSLEKLSPEYQKILLEAIREVTSYERQLSLDSDSEYLEKLQAEGVKVITEIDKAVWKEAVQPLYDQYRERIGADLLDRIESKMKSD